MPFRAHDFYCNIVQVGPHIRSRQKYVIYVLYKVEFASKVTLKFQLFAQKAQIEVQQNMIITIVYVLIS